MPALLSLICRLFAREFETQYALIRERINRSFLPYKEGDLCLYRSDLVETHATPKSGISSKPEQIVSQLLQHISTIQKNIQKKKLQ
jgi:hypothetical protein